MRIFSWCTCSHHFSPMHLSSIPIASRRWPSRVLLFRHGNAVHNQKFFAASLALLTGHENEVKERGGYDFRFAMAVLRICLTSKAKRISA